MEPFPYQQIGIDFLASPCGNKPHKMLADAPGLGKTLQACLALKKVGAKTALIITPAPLVIKNSWRKTLNLCGFNDVQIVMTGKDKIGASPILIVNYELLQNKELFASIYWGKYDAVIVDEAQRLKSLNSARSLRILGGSPLVARGWHKWFLTGTPMPNRPVELFPILATMCPELLGRYADWKKYIQRYCGAYCDENGWNWQGASNVDELREKIRPFMLRREVEDVYEEMPSVVESSLFIDLGSMDLDETNTETATLRKTIGIAKIPYCIEYLQYRLIQSDSKILAFTYHREVSEQIAKALGDDAVLIYGGMSSEQKQRELLRFTEGSATILIGQQQSMGEGVDSIQHVCHNIVDCEPEWSDGAYAQQLGRCWRIGQTKTVYRVGLIAENTLEETILAVRANKHKNVLKLYEKNTQNGETKMSLEDAIKENTEAVKALTAALGKNVSTTGTTPSGANGKAPAAEKSESASSATELTVDDLRAAGGETIVLLGETDENRARIQAVCKAHGSKTGKADGVPKAKIGACIAAIKALADEPIPVAAGAGI